MNTLLTNLLSHPIKIVHHVKFYGRIFSIQIRICLLTQYHEAEATTAIILRHKSLQGVWIITNMSIFV